MDKRVAVGLALLFLATCMPAQAEMAQWTVLVYLNADNNLEADGLIDFAEMAQIGSSPNVNVIVQFDRIGKYTRFDPNVPHWENTRRFRVLQNQRPDDAATLISLEEINMGAKERLGDFVEWGIQHYPAHKYALILWDHGDGWKVVKPAGDNEPRVSENYRSTQVSPHKAVSHDETNGDQLYNREIQSELEARLPAILAAAGSSKSKLDIIGFDACLMAMVETGYAMRNIAEFMVASEELEPGTGWAYHRFLKALVERPQLTGLELAKEIVQSYKDQYTDTTVNAATTLSAFDLREMGTLASELTAFADAMAAAVATNEIVKISSARDACKVYAPEKVFYHVDLVHFLQKYAAATANPSLKSQATELAARFQAAVIDNYAGSKRRGSFGSNGLAIYFPRSGTAYRGDYRAQGGYERKQTDQPESADAIRVEFVEKENWTQFLHAYFARRPD